MLESEPMSAHYQISERDYVHAGMLAGRPTRRTLGLLLLLAVVLAGMMGIDGGRWHWSGVMWVIAWIAMVWLVVWLVWPWRLRHHYRRYKMIHDELVVSLLDEGVRFTSPNGEARLLWDKMLKWRCNAEYVLIYSMPRMFHMVPVTLAAQGFDVERLKAALAQHVGPAEWWL